MKEIVDYGIGIVSLFVLYGTFNIWRAILKNNGQKSTIEEQTYLRRLVEQQTMLIKEATCLVQEVRILVEKENVMLNEILERLRQWG